jgi:phosphoglycolate phosphatase-like HAD superfamily hydrolase
MAHRQAVLFSLRSLMHYHPVDPDLLLTAAAGAAPAGVTAGQTPLAPSTYRTMAVRLVRDNGGDPLDLLVKQYGLDRAQARRAYWDDLDQRILFRPSVSRLFDLERLDAEIVLVTNAPRTLRDRFLSAAGLLGVFTPDRVVCPPSPGSVVYPKDLTPHLYERACQIYEVLPEDALVVDTHRPSLSMARKFGAATALLPGTNLPTAYRSLAPVSDLFAPDHRFGSLSHVLQHRPRDLIAGRQSLSVAEQMALDQALQPNSPPPVRAVGVSVAAYGR